MPTRSIIHQARLKEWASKFVDQKSSGLSVTEWCRQNNLSKYKFFYWKRLLKDEALSQALPEIVPLNIPTLKTEHFQTQAYDQVSNTSCTTRTTCTSFPIVCARVYINSITIEFDSLASEDFIKTLISVCSTTGYQKS